MKTVILCGGIGYRLKEETEFKPKPMVLVGGKPILWHIMKMYSHYGFNDFIIALGYKGNLIKEYFLNQKYFSHDFSLSTKSGVTSIHKNRISGIADDFYITFVDTGESTLPGERILRMKNYIPESDRNFMVTYGDGVSDLNIAKLVAFHKKQNTIGTVTGVHPRSKYGLLSVNERHIVHSFTEKPVLVDWVNGGFMVFKRKALNYFKENEMEHEGLKRLIGEKQLSLYIHDKFWFAVDTYKELEDLNTMWTKQESPWKLW
ncbi:MAG: sugar phosphate nucleotidyltransferase [Candidatus Gottesmanbacteria bacterium]